MNSLDLVVVGVVAVSGLLAFMRGLVRETLAIAAWIGAAVVTWYCYNPALPITQGFVSSKLLAQVVTIGVLFIGSVILFAFVTGLVSTQVRESSLGPLDRALGLAFGVARGAVFACFGYMAMVALIPNPTERPAWIREARSLPLLDQGATLIRDLIPRDALERRGLSIEDSGRRAEAAGEASTAIAKAASAVDALAQPKVKAPSPPATPPGNYKPDQQQELNRLFQTTEDPPK